MEHSIIDGMMKGEMLKYLVYQAPERQLQGKQNCLILDPFERPDEPYHDYCGQKPTHFARFKTDKGRIINVARFLMPSDFGFEKSPSKNQENSREIFRFSLKFPIKKEEKTIWKNFSLNARETKRAAYFGVFYGLRADYGEGFGSYDGNYEKLASLFFKVEKIGSQYHLYFNDKDQVLKNNDFHCSYQRIKEGQIELDSDTVAEFEKLGICLPEDVVLRAKSPKNHFFYSENDAPFKDW